MTVRNPRRLASKLVKVSPVNPVPGSLLCKLLCIPGGQNLASDEETPGFPGFLLCKMLCNLLCRLLCSVSVACMHNKLRPGCGVGGRAQLSSPASPMGRDLAGGVGKKGTLGSYGQMDHGQVRMSCNRGRPIGAVTCVY